MLLTRTPLRLSLGGGGTDLPAYAHEHHGFTVSAAINRYVYVGANPTFTGDYSVKYLDNEHVKTIDEIQHPIFRETLRLLDVQPGVEFVSLADVPRGTGLGSSASFTVGLARAIYTLQRKPCSPRGLAYDAFRVEARELGRPVGKQDQFTAAHGGLMTIEYRHNIDVVRPLILSDATLQDLEDNLLLFFTGYARDADLMLEDQRRRKDERSMVENLDQIKKIGREIHAALLEGDTLRFAELLSWHWKVKEIRSDGMTNDRINGLYAYGMKSGALGGKLVGAGAGGFLLFYTRDHARLRAAMADADAPELRFGFDHDGTTLLTR